MTITTEMITEALASGQTHKEILAIIEQVLEICPKIKVAVNRCCGEYSISRELAEKAGLDAYDMSKGARTNPIVIAAIEKDANAASGTRAKLGIEEVPLYANWYVTKYEGNEYIAW